MLAVGQWKKEGQEEARGDGVRAKGRGTEGGAQTKMAGKVESFAEPRILVSSPRIQEFGTRSCPYHFPSSSKHLNPNKHFISI